MPDYDVFIKLIDAVHLDPGTDRRGCYKTGDIVEVRIPGTYGRGTDEVPPKFAVIYITEVPEEVNFKALLESPEFEDGEGESIIYRRRRHQVDTSAIPSTIWDEIVTTGEYTISWNTIKNYLRDKKTGFTL